MPHTRARRDDAKDPRIMPPCRLMRKTARDYGVAGLQAKFASQDFRVTRRHC